MLTTELKTAVPYSVVGSNVTINRQGRKTRGRQYPWGIVEIENPSHCDFIKLRTMLITYMQDLKEVTQDFHYENFRAQRLATPPMPHQTESKKRARATAADISHRGERIADKDAMLKEKELELQRMQERIMKMQLQMKHAQP